jgi:hypothetical protein
MTRKALSPGRALELAAIGRRTAETEWELLGLMEGEEEHGTANKELRTGKEEE